MSFKHFKNPFNHIPHLGGGFQRKSEGCHVVAFSFVEGGGRDVRPLITHQNLGVLAGRGYAVGIVHLVDERGPGAVVGYRRHSGLGRSLGNAGIQVVPGVGGNVGTGDEHVSTTAGIGLQGILKIVRKDRELVRNGPAAHLGGELLAADEIYGPGVGAAGEGFGR